MGWFEVSSYDVSALVAALAGKATFSPLTVTLAATGLTGVLADLARGTVIRSVRLEGVTGGSNPQAVYDLTLGNVTVSDYEDASGGDKLSLSYQQVALTTTAINSDGSLGSSQTFSWNVATNSADASIPAPVPGTAGGNLAPTNLKYFLAIDGLNGGSTDAKHVGWFEVSSYDVSALVAALAGKATFSPLTVTLAATGLTGVLADLARGTVIRSVRLEGVTGGSNPQAVYDLTLGNVTVSDYEDASGGDKLSLSYQQVALTTTAINSDGSLGSSQTFSWNVATNSADASIPAPVPGTAGGNLAPTNLKYFLAIDGLNGGSTDAKHVGWFEVSSYDVSALVAALAGKATFSPLTVTLAATGLTGVLADLARGTVIRSVRLEGVTGGSNPQAVYDLTLGNVTVSDYEDASGGDKLSLSYQQVALTTTAINSDGSLGSSQTFSWNVATNSADASIPAPVPGTAGGNLAPTNLKYFLAIDGLNGGSTDAKHVGWFEVSSYDVSALVAALAGKATFSPLTVTLAATGLTGVLADLARGTVIRSVRLEGVTGGSNPQAVYDLTLGNVTVSDYEDASGGDKLSLSYQQVALTTTAINSDGSLGSSQTFSWNVATNSADASIPAPVPGNVAKNASLTASSLFSVSDADGDAMTQYHFWDSTADGTSGHFAINGVAQGTNQIINVSAAQLAQTTFQTGTTADDLWVQAFDGTVWSDWKEFHLTPPVNHAPVVAVADQNVAKNASLTASSLFSVSDADGDAMTQYQFWDSTADGTSGHFAINGVAQGTNQIINVGAAQLAQTTFQTGTTADDLWVQAFDGTVWSDWKEFHLTPPVNHAPVVAVADQNVAKNASLTASSLFSVSDADGDAMTQYHFWDSTADGTSGHFAINGVAQGTNQIINVGAAQLAQTTFQTGTTADDLWVQVFDGSVWSDWKEFHLTPAVNQALVGTEGNDVLTGAAGDDTIQALGGDDVLRGGPGGDSLDGGPGRDILYVDNLDKAVTGGADFDIVYGDASTAQNGFNFVLAGKNVEAAYGNDGNDVIDASTLSNYQTMLFGGNGDDVLIAGTNGSYTLNGGEGSDTAVLPGNQSDYTIDPNPAGWPGWMTVTNNAGGFIYWMQQVERLQFADATIDAPQLPVNQVGTSAADTITAGNGGEVIYGLGGGDRLVGGLGNDSLVGGPGADQLIGGAGDDDLFIDNNDTLIDGGDGWDSIYVDDTQGAPAAVHLTLAGTNVEFVYGGMGNDVFDASGVSTGIEMWGQWADDVLIGGSGDDTLLGDEWLIGGGNDILDGGAGNDWLDGGNGSDTFVFRAGCGLDTLYDFGQTQDATGTMVMAPEDHDVIRFEGGLFANFDALVASGAMAQVGANVVITLDATDQITLRNMSISNLDAGDFVFAVTVNGTASDDVITGDARAESINGLAGNDQINGGAGDDWLSGGDGNDILTGGPGADQLIGGPGTDFLWIDAQDTLIDGGDGLDYLYLDYTQPGQHFTVAGTHVEIVSGTLYDDVIDASGVTYGTVLFGNYGNDVLIGGAGNDSLQPAPGNDTLDGGGGVDTGIYYSGVRSDFQLTKQSDGSFLIADQRPGSPEGTDRVTNVEIFQFADESYIPTAVAATNSDPTTIGAGQKLELASDYSGTIAFTASTGTLQFDNSSSFSGTVAGLAGQDTLDLRDITAGASATVNYSGDASGGTLKLTDGTHVANIALLGNYLASTFVASSDGHGGTTVHDPQALGGVQPLVTPPHA